MSQIDPGTSSWLRMRNDREALRLFLEHGPLTRSMLGELSGMSKPTATQMIARLERAELLRPVGEVAGSRGPSAVSWGVRSEQVTGVAVNMIDDGIQAVLVDALDTEHRIIDLPLPREQRSPEQDLDRAIDAACRAADADRTSVAVIAVGLQAAVSADTDSLSLTDSLPGWPPRGSRARIESALGVAALLENDVNLATMAERSSGVAQDAGSFALLWLGVGLGVGVDIGGSVFRGANGGAGEIGYLSVADGPGATAAVTTALLGADGIVAITDCDTYPQGLDRIGDDPRTLHEIADRVAVTVEPVLAVLDPQLLVLGGPTALAGGAALADRVAQRTRGDGRPMPEVRISATGESAVLAGARALLVEQVRARLEDRIPTH